MDVKIDGHDGYLRTSISRRRLYASVSVDFYPLDADASDSARAEVQEYLQGLFVRWRQGVEAGTYKWPRGGVHYSTGPTYWSISSVPKQDADGVLDEWLDVLRKPDALTPIRLSD